MKEETQSRVSEQIEKLDNEDFKRTMTYGSDHFKINVAMERLGVLSRGILDDEDEVVDREMVKLAGYLLYWHEVRNER